MRSPVIILGTNPIQLGEDALVESENSNLEEIEALLAAKPRAAVITSGGEPGFFRASLCLERGVSRVILRRGAFEESWERELAARAQTFGAELYVHDDARGYGRVKPGGRLTVGLAGIHDWSTDPLRAEWAEDVREAEPLALEPHVEGLPSNLEEVAFIHGDKPVLYLVIPASDFDSLLVKYADATIVRREIPLKVEAATGRRVYASNEGTANAHVFISRDPGLAKRAAQLWDEGSSRHLVEIGALMGYPSCCVAAFAALGERGNNAALTYVTAARSRALGASFEALLNSAFRHVIPCTPCTFGCGRALQWAERIVHALPVEVAEKLRRALARPVLYFDESRAIVFDGARKNGQTIGYEKARFLPPSAPLDPDEEMATRRLFGALFRGPGEFRINPKMGVVLPFGV